MANRYWVGGTASWDATAGTKWATTSGGAGGSAVPTAADDVFLDGPSGAVTVTISGSRVCRSFTCTGFTGTLTGTSSPVLSIGDASGGAMTLVAGMTVGTAPTLNFVSTSNNGGTGWAITTGGQTLSHMTFDGVGGKWVLQDTVSLFFGAVTLTNGTLDTNSKTMNIHNFASSNSNTRTLTLGSSTINCDRLLSAGAFWETTTTTGLTFSGASSTIVLGPTSSGLTRNFNGGGLTYGTLSYTATGSTGRMVVAGSNTFNTINVGSGRSIAFTVGTTNTVTNWNVNGALFEYQRISGTSGDYISTPDSAALSITGDITILTRVAMDSWTPSSSKMFVAKRAVTGNQRSYHWNISGTGFMAFVISTDGTAVIAATADAATGFAAGSTNWVLVSRRSSDGRVQFYKADGSLTNPAASDFTQIGTDQTPAAGAIFDGTAPLEVGSSDLGTVQPAPCNVYRTIVYNGLFSTAAFGGTIQFDADFTRKKFGDNTFTESSANAATVTMNGSTIYGDGRVDVDSDTVGSHFLTKATAGVFASDYLVVTRSVASGGTWYAGGHSVDGTANSGWIFQTYGDGRFLSMF